MDDGIKKMTKERIEMLYEQLEDPTLSANDRLKMTIEIKNLCSLLQEDEKIIETVEARKELNRNNKILGLVKTGCDVGSNMVGYGLWGAIALVAIKFEETGNLTGIISKAVVNSVSKFGKILK